MPSLLPLCQLDAFGKYLYHLVEIGGKKTFLKSNFDQSFILRLGRTSLEKQTLHLITIRIKVTNVGDIRSNFPQ